MIFGFAVVEQVGKPVFKFHARVFELLEQVDTSGNYFDLY
jgi:hypothetical protein